MIPLQAIFRKLSKLSHISKLLLIVHPPMFSRLLTSALKTFQTSETINPTINSTQDATVKMVTTRRQSGNKVVAAFNDDGEAMIEGISQDEVPAELLSPESRKRRREKAKEEDLQLEGVKKRKLPLRNKDEAPEIESHTHFDIVMDVSGLPERRTESTVSKAEPGKKRSKNSSRNDIDPVSADIPMKTTPKKSKSKSNNPVFQTAHIPASTSTKPKHKKFSDNITEDTPTEPIPATVIEVQNSDEEEEDDSEDDAPEEVAASEAQQTVLAVAREAAKAAELQASLKRQKRKSHAQKINAQAEFKKRKLDVGHDSDKDPAPEPETTTNAAKNPVPQTLKLDKTNLPKFLPLEYLEDTPAATVDTDTDKDSDYLSNHESLFAISNSAKWKRGKKTRFEEVLHRRDETWPRDLVKNGVVYRVAKKESAILPPKAAKSARGVKEAWLKGRKGAERKRVGGGFFVQ